VGDLAGDLGATQQNVSKHLQTLHTAGAVARRKEGNTVYYSVADTAMVEMCDQVCGSMERRLDAMASVLKPLQRS